MLEREGTGISAAGRGKGTPPGGGTAIYGLYEYVPL